MKPVRLTTAPCRLHFASPVWYALLVSSMYLVLLNHRFWREALALCWRGNAADLPFLLALFLLLLMGFSLALLLIPGRRPMHVASGALFPLGAMAAYTADSYGLAVDADMVRSLAHATGGEAGALLGPRLLLYALLLGVLPLFVVGSSRITPLPLRQHLRHRLLFCGAALALGAVLAAPFAARFRGAAALRCALPAGAGGGAAGHGALRRFRPGLLAAGRTGLPGCAGLPAAAPAARAGKPPAGGVPGGGRNRAPRQLPARRLSPADQSAAVGHAARALLFQCHLLRHHDRGVAALHAVAAGPGALHRGRRARSAERAGAAGRGRRARCLARQQCGQRRHRRPPAHGRVPRNAA